MKSSNPITPTKLLIETTTPTAITSIGQIYTKADNVFYFQDGAGNEHVLAVADAYYAEMFFNDNAVATTIETADTPIMLRNTTTGLLNGWTYNTGSTGAITAFSDGTGKVNVASGTHGLETGDVISIRGTTNYNGLWEITKIDGDNFSIPDTWAVNDGASDWDQGDYLKAGASAAGVYSFAYEISGTVAAADLLKSRIAKNSSLCNKCVGLRQFVNNDYGCGVGCGIVEIAADDRLAICIQSDATNPITVKFGNMNLHRL